MTLFDDGKVWYYSWRLRRWVVDKRIPDAAAMAQRDALAKAIESGEMTLEEAQAALRKKSESSPVGGR